MKNFLAGKPGIIIVGVIIGVTAALLQKLGNPGNMGICIACFIRDTTGAIGFQNTNTVQYIRPEIIGIVLGSFVISFFTKEFKSRGGSSPIIRFFLGIYAMIGALVFLGCTWRVLLRLAGGDGSAIFGLAGLIAGVFIASIFIRKGYSLGRNYPMKNKFPGLLIPIAMLGLFLLLVFNFSKINLSTQGPGSLHAPIYISIIAGLIIGVLAQRSRFCTIGAIRDVIIIGRINLLLGAAALVVSSFIMNIILGQFHPGFINQPIAHNSYIWNFLGMLLSGLAFTFAGGCPGRQLILAGEGDTDSGVFILGLIIGAALAHNFGLASSPGGIGPFGAAATISGIIFCLIVGFVMIERRKQSS